MRNIRKIVIPPQATIREALEVIDRGVQQIALVVQDNRLVGTLTDGDIRRAVLQGKSLEDPVTGIYNDSPVKGRVNQSREDLLQMGLAKGIKQIPMVDEQGCLVGIEHLDDYLRVTEKPNPVVLMAGGLGTRLRPLTEKIPKPMLKVGERPILETIIQNFARHGFRNFYLSVNYKAEAIREHFGNGSRLGVDIRYLEEQKRLGTAGALTLLPEAPQQPLIVMNGDLLTNVNFEHLINYHQITEAFATMCVREFEIQVPYGVVQTEGATIQEIQEKPVHRFYVNAGIYVIAPEMVQSLPPGEYFDMPHLFQQTIAAGKKVCSFPIQEYWMDIGRPGDFERANMEFEGIFDV